MKIQRILPRIISAATVLFSLLAFATSVRAQVITSDPSLPVLYPTGVYRTPDAIFAQYNGPGLQIVFNNSLELRASGPVSRPSSGSDEIEQFNMQQIGAINVNGGPFSSSSASGPSQWVTHGKLGNTTGTFNTEMLSLNLSGTSPFGPFMIRESPTLPSLGQTAITDIGGGLFRIDSFFDVFTELSVDGGATWMPDSQGPAHINLVSVPEPSVCALAGLGAGLFALRGNKRRSYCSVH
jgi:hypothetical protein